MMFERYSNASESASDDFACGGDHGESVWIDFFDLFAKADGIDSVAYGVDHGFIRSAEAADNLLLVVRLF